MLKSRLLYYSLLIALATIEVWAVDNAGASADLTSAVVTRMIRDEGCSLWRRVEHMAIEDPDMVEGLILERTPALVNGPRERALPAIGTPTPTPTPSLQPQKRQDDGQIQALSEQLRSVSESATQAISSVSSSASSAISLVSQSAQSVRQSADQAVQSANQNADNANRQLSQTQSSASSAISASLSSMSSRISSNLASAQSSASSQISAAQAEASRSAANAVSIAASQIQEARADASGIRGDATSFVQQVQSNSVSGTNVAIIVSVAVVGSAFISTLITCLVLRYRRKKKSRREGEAGIIITSEKLDKKAVAVRGSPPSTPRFTPFGGGTGYPMDKLKLPALSPLIKRKKVNGEGNNVGLATSDFTSNTDKRDSNTDVYGVSDTSFRLQKPKGIQKATSVRLIRVGSGKSKATEEEDEQALIERVPSPPPLVSQEPQKKPEPQPSQPSQSQETPVLSPDAGPSEPVEPVISSPEIIQAPTLPQPTAEPPRQSMLSTRNSVTRPPVRSTLTSQQRLRFRDSSDVESAEPTPLGWQPSLAASAGSTTTTTTSMRNTNTASLRMTPAGKNDLTQGLRRPKNAGASFATFPRIRNGPRPPRVGGAGSTSGGQDGKGAGTATATETSGPNNSNNGATATAAAGTTTTINWPLIGK
ncbi:hypothetical protein F4775DRAFT_485807 [Biscogniauxia sp. FL1348]|nr:hypothetical protein F4775DRAFT_485807 [Biscogniauxia sp. FL1348]